MKKKMINPIVKLKCPNPRYKNRNISKIRNKKTIILQATATFPLKQQQ